MANVCGSSEDPGAAQAAETDACMRAFPNLNYSHVDDLNYSDEGQR